MATLIPAETLTASLTSIQDTAVDAFGYVLPVIVTIAALVIALRLIKRFINEITEPDYTEGVGEMPDDGYLCPECGEWTPEYGPCEDCLEQYEDERIRSEEGDN